jgi:hypothetical protein
MDALIGLVDGWAGFLSLAFFGDLLLILAAATGFAMVARAALRAPVRPFTRRLTLLASLVFFGLILAKGLGFLG